MATITDAGLCSVNGYILAWLVIGIRACFIHEAPWLLNETQREVCRDNVCCVTLIPLTYSLHCVLFQEVKQSSVSQQQNPRENQALIEELRSQVTKRLGFVMPVCGVRTIRTESRRQSFQLKVSNSFIIHAFSNTQSSCQVYY